MKQQSPFIEQTEQYMHEIKSGMNSILVTVRIRPLNTKQKQSSQFYTIKVLDDKLLVLNQPENTNTVDILRKNRNKDGQFAFDYVFGHNITTQEIYQNVVSILLDGVFQGFNATVLAYGATSCGKTYTMIGEHQKPGIMALTVLDILNRAKQLNKHKNIKFKASYIQIYNENIKDLLISEDTNFELREDPKEGVVITGVTEVTINTLSQLKTILKVGSRNRTKQSTGCNQSSSRSHAILQIQIQSREKAQSTIQETNYSKLSLVDLAGSERASNTTNRGQRMVQGAKINQSLLTLGNCIQALSEASQKGLKNAFIPYRGSKLTRLLKDSLGGNCRTVMIAHVTPSVSAFQQTYNTIIYANRTKNIKNNAVRNILNADTHISNYTNVITVLKKQNQELKSQLLYQKQIMRISPNKSLPLLQSSAYDELIKKYERQISQHFEKQYQIISKISYLNKKIEIIAFQIFAEQIQKSGDTIHREKIREASELSKQKLGFQKRVNQLGISLQKIIKDINLNDILGKLGQPYILNYIKQKKIQVHEKSMKVKQQALEQQKKSISNFLKKLKKHLYTRDKIIEAQKILIKKNNIISRITYSQLNFSLNNDDISNKKQNINIEKQIFNKNQYLEQNQNKTKMAKGLRQRNDSIIQPQDIIQDQGYRIKLNKLLSKKDSLLNYYQNNQLSRRSDINNRSIQNRSKSNRRQDVKRKNFQNKKISQDTFQQNDSPIIIKKDRSSKNRRISPQLHKNSPHKRNDYISNNKKSQKKKASDPRFDFVYIPH